VGINARGVVAGESAQILPGPHIMHDIISAAQPVNFGKLECLRRCTVADVDHEDVDTFTRFSSVVFGRGG